MASEPINLSLSNIFRNRKLQKILLAIKMRELNVIEPVVEFDSGVSYPALNKILGSRGDAEETLKILSEVGLLIPEIVDSIIVCPECSSHKMLLRVSCPSCGSSRVIRGSMIEHLECGHIDFEEAFKGIEGLVCPHCKKPLRSIGEDYRTYSFLYRCLSCRSVFQSPKIKYLCNNGHEIDENNIKIQNIKAYRFNPKRERLLEQVTVNLEDALQPLIERGWRVEFPAVIPGAAGAEHEFTFASWNKHAKKGEDSPDLVGFLHLSESEVSTTDVLAFWAKSVDAGAKRRVLMTMTKMSEEGKALAKAYSVDVVEGRDAAELQARLKKRMHQIVEDVKKEAAEIKEKESAEATSEQMG